MMIRRSTLIPLALALSTGMAAAEGPVSLAVIETNFSEVVSETDVASQPVLEQLSSMQASAVMDEARDQTGGTMPTDIILSLVGVSILFSAVVGPMQ